MENENNLDDNLISVDIDQLKKILDDNAKMKNAISLSADLVNIIINALFPKGMPQNLTKMQIVALVGKVPGLINQLATIKDIDKVFGTIVGTAKEMLPTIEVKKIGNDD